VGDELTELGRRARKHRAAEVGKACFQPGIGEARIDLDVELVNDSGWRVFGARTPTHWLPSKPGTKSLTVGMSGSASERIAVVTAKARSLPALMYSIDAAMSVNVT